MNNAKRARQAVIYCRISDDREGREYGVDRQEAHCRRLADRRGWHVVAVLVDNDITGTGRKRRPGYDRLMTMLKDGTANAVLAVSDKRLNRNYRNAFELLDLIQAQDIAVEFTKGGPINMNTAEGRGIARRKAIDAQEESEEIGERVADAKKDNVRDGTYRGGGRPFGYEADGITPRSLVCPECGATEGFVITVVREDDGQTIKAVTVACPQGCDTEPVNAPGSEAWYLEAAIRAVAGGVTNRSELRKWHEAGVRTPARRKRLPDGTRTEPTPGEWTPTTFLKLLRRPRNAGLMEVDGEITGRAAWPGVVDETTWRVCEAVLKNPARRTTPGPARKWLGGGLFLCGVCNGPMTVTGRGRERGSASAYICGTGKHVSRDAAAVDEFVTRKFIEVMTRRLGEDTEEPDAQLAGVPEELMEEAERLRKRLAATYAAFADDEDTDPAEIRRATRDLKTRIAAVEAKIAEAVLSSERAATQHLTPFVLLPNEDDVADVWKRCDLDRRREFVSDLLTVTVMPAPRGRPKGQYGGTYFREEAVRVEEKERVTTTNA